MKVLSLKGTDQTPEVHLDKSNEIFSVSGRSILDDASLFYQPILQWINDYVKEPNPTTVLTFKFDYINNPSSKMVFDILTLLNKIEGASVIWYYKSGEEGMEEVGEEFSELVQFPFDLKPY